MGGQGISVTRGSDTINLCALEVAQCTSACASCAVVPDVAPQPNELQPKLSYY